MSAFELVNWGEVILWPAIGLVCLGFAIKRGRRSDRYLWLLAPTFVLFGVSDYIELHTGAWWDPLGLLVLNAACIAVFVAVGVSYYRRRDRRNTRSLTAKNPEREPESMAEDGVPRDARNAGSGDSS